MAGGIEDIIDILYNMVEDAHIVPLGKGKAMIDREKVLDLLDEVRGNLPADIKAARDIVEKRNELLAATKKEAEALQKQAEDKARAMVNESELVMIAKRRANEIIANAEAKSKEIKDMTNAYCEEILKKTETAVGESLKDISTLRAQFKQAVSANK